MKSKISLSLAALAACFALGLPAQSALAKTPMVACKDGTHAKAGRGACSGHGGVAMAKAKARPKHAWTTKLKGKEESHPSTMHVAVKPDVAKKSATSGAMGAAGATARCKDGTYSHAKGHRGACSRHGGVAEWLKH